MTEGSRVRVTIVGIVIISLFATLLARLWYLQVMAGQAFAAEAQSNRVKIVRIEAPRGQILDRQGRVLIDNRVSNVITVSRSLVGDDKNAVLDRLAQLLAMPRADLERRLSNKRYSHYKPIPLAEDVAEDALVYVREHQELFPGVDAIQVPIRRYNHGSLMAHLLGYVGEINDVELSDNDGYELGDLIGKSGVEASFEADLRGKPGTEELEIERQGRVVGVLRTKEPVKGHDLQLTVDLDVQRLAEESLAQGIAAAHAGWDDEYKKHFIAPAGSVVVLDSRDGSIVAMASFPTYEPTEFIGGIDPALFRTLNDPSGYYPLNNRAIQGQYAPGSTFKVITALAGLRTELITPSTTIEDKGSIRVGDRTLYNAGKKSHGRVDLARALAVSSNVYFYRLGFQIWQQEGSRAEEIQRVARSFGFGERTGVALGSEQDGRVPDEEWKRTANEDHPKAFPDGVWRPGDNVNLATGQGEMLATPLQLANAYAALANGGTVFVPRIAAGLIGEDGKTVREFKPKVGKQALLNEANRGALMAGLRGAVVNEEGTAAPAFAGFPHTQVKVAGKTGTALVNRKQDTSLFAGIVPVDSPQYVVVAVVEEAGFGSAIAAPIVRRIIAGLMKLDIGSVAISQQVD